MNTAPATASEHRSAAGDDGGGLRHEQPEHHPRPDHGQAVEGVLPEHDGGHERHRRPGDERESGSHPVKGRLPPVADDPI